MRLWDRLSGPEKGALVRQWQRFSDLYFKVDEVSSQPYLLAQAHEDSIIVEDFSKARARYLRGLIDAWHRLTFPAKPTWEEVRIPGDLYVNDADLDHWLWEMHPGNVLDVLQQETNKENDDATAPAVPTGD